MKADTTTTPPYFFFPRKRDAASRRREHKEEDGIKRASVEKKREGGKDEVSLSLTNGTADNGFTSAHFCRCLLFNDPSPR